LCGVPADEEIDLCMRCARTPPVQRGTVVWGEYDGVLRSAILTLKHKGRDDLAPPLAMRLASLVAAADWAEDITMVSWIPSHVVRRLRRPFPAARMVADEVARRIGLPCRRVLARRGTGRQTGRTRSRRLQLPRDAFRARRSALEHTVLLVDDVITTGTTFERAAEAALGAGASAVYCAALAMTPDSRSFS
jgi:predicted amidophosphoribosyltransferase